MEGCRGPSRRLGSRWPRTAAVAEKRRLLRLRFEFQSFFQQAFQVQPITAEGEVTVLILRPLVFGAVPGELEAIAIGIAQVEVFVRAVVLDPVQRPSRPGLPRP